MRIKQTKCISKSIRLTQEVYDFINQYDGDGFNDKLEHLVLFALKEGPELERQHTYYCEAIKEKLIKLQEVDKKLRTCNYISSRLSLFCDELEQYLESMTTM